VALSVPYTTSYLTEHCGDDAYATLEGYRERGGYTAARRALQSEPAELVELVARSGLQGRGGTGSRVAAQWSALASEPAGPRYLACNANESEPGSFKDRLLLERAPHALIEGILIAARATGAERTFLFIRGEYGHAATVMERAIDEARAGGVLGKSCLRSRVPHDIVITRGAGAYTSGESTGLLESLEGKRAQPRRTPLQPAQSGLFGRPTAVNNIETLCHLPHIVQRGVDWFRSIGTEESPGTMLFGVSGHVVRPGLYELPLGTPLDEIVFEHAGGVPAGRRVKAVMPGGVSSPILPAGKLDVAMAAESLRERDSRLGRGGVIVMDATTCMVRVACVISSFFRDESCGQCTQCREGTAWLHKLVQRIERGAGTSEDIAILLDVAGKLEGQTICAFADFAAWPIQALLRHFMDDFDAHVRQHKCPFPGSFEL
jgi:NADH-quinone oxidoreductase subunit F